jgi:hypothetical protein
MIIFTGKIPRETRSLIESAFTGFPQPVHVVNDTHLSLEVEGSDIQVRFEGRSFKVLSPGDFDRTCLIGDDAPAVLRGVYE